MKKIIFGIFAHPDDEALGPAGTLLQETRAGTELHLITLTAGEAGANPDALSDLGAARLEEWRAAGRLLGAKTMEFFGYRDGRLNNIDMIEISKKLVNYIPVILKDAPEDVAVELMSLDLNGYTGHIDHIVAARAACFAFYKLKEIDPRFRRIRLACLPSDLVPTANTDWIFMERGRLPSEIDEVVDARELKEDILKVMKVHHTQRSDYEFNLRQQGDNLGRNHFIVKE